MSRALSAIALALDSKRHSARRQRQAAAHPVSPTQRAHLVIARDRAEKQLAELERAAEICNGIAVHWDGLTDGAGTALAAEIRARHPYLAERLDELLEV